MRFYDNFEPIKKCPKCKSKDIGFEPFGKHMDRLNQKCFGCDKTLGEVKMRYDPGEFYYMDKQLKDYKINQIHDTRLHLKIKYDSFKKFLKGELKTVRENNRIFRQGDVRAKRTVKDIIFRIGPQIHEMDKWLKFNGVEIKDEFIKKNNPKNLQD